MMPLDEKITSIDISVHNRQDHEEGVVPADFDLLSPIVEDMVMREKPVTILEISPYGIRYGELFAGCQKRLGIDGGKIDRMNLKPGAKLKDGVYSELLPAGALGDIDALGIYDFIFIPGLPDGMSRDEAVALFSKLQEHVIKQVLFVTPEYIPGRAPVKREFHPLTFTGFDFSFWMHNTDQGNWQFYSFYKKRSYEPMPMDDITDREVKTDRKMRLAFILPHQGLNGGLKALLQQMRCLHRAGHTVKAYFRSNYCNRVIPSWSELRDEDISEQIVVPEGAAYLDYIKDVDLILVGWLELIPEFLNAGIPVVLWEQGYEYLYGDYNARIDSSYWFRQYMINIYRSPIHLLSVSPFISDILRARYNRKTSVFPPCVDTDLFFPWTKNEELPPVLLVGHPKHKLKGFDFAFDVLKNAWDRGARFKVWWALQEAAEDRDTPFEVSYYYMLPQDALALLYRFAYVFVSASWFEACPLPPIEAMASGTAVLATDSGGIRTYAAPGENCLLFEQGDIDGMTKGLITLLTDPELRRKLAAEGRKTALKFSAGQVADGIEKTLKSIAFAPPGYTQEPL